MIGELPPGSAILIGALLLPLLRGHLRSGYVVLLTAISFGHMVYFHPDGLQTQWSLFGLQLNPIRSDRISLVWGYIFHLATALAALYGSRTSSTLELICGLAYAASAIGAVFAGDLLTLFVYWELTAVFSVFLVLSGSDATAAIRYLLWQIGSGLALLAGMAIYVADGHGVVFGMPGQTGVFDLAAGQAAWLFLLAFGIKAAFPLLHVWLPDAYPVANAAGAVFLSIYTTKMAIYALLRGFAGTELLLPIGTAMAILPLIYGLLENDLRRVLAYSLISQLGYMVVAIGVGSDLAIDGASAHAFVHILYKGLLFMAIGAVLTATGTAEATRLGRLYRQMPWTCAFCIIAAASISAVPLFAGFVSKSLIMSALGKKHLFYPWVGLLCASAGVVLYCGIKVPLFGFFGRGEPDIDTTRKPIPGSMMIAMAVAAAACLLAGLWPAGLYRLLPHQSQYQPYTASHVLTQLQLLLAAAFVFLVSWTAGLYPRMRPTQLLDADWIWRGLCNRVLHRGYGVLQWSSDGVGRLVKGSYNRLDSTLEQLLAEDSRRGWSRATGWMAVWAALLLVGFLWLAYL